MNFKTYPKGTGRAAVELAKVCAEASGEIPIIPVVQAVDLYQVKQATGEKEVWVQHVDGVGYGQNTGWILPEAIKEAGAEGTFLNHSEHKVLEDKEKEKEQLERSVGRCREAGLKVLIFAADLEELREVLALKPDYVAYEPPELIGSKEHSVAERPEIIFEAAEMVKAAGVPLLAGAGIHSPQDVRSALVSGAKGVAVARDILEAEDPRSEMVQLLEGFTHPGVELIGK